MLNPVAPDDVIAVVREFLAMNAGDEATEAIIYAMGAQMLGISVDSLIKLL